MKITATSAEVGEEIQGEILATLQGEQIGRLSFTDYADYRGGRTVQINLVTVDPAHRREGVATALVAELRKTVPTSRAGQFALNPSGRALRDAIFDQFSQPIA